VPNLATHITFANELNKSEKLIDNHDKGIYLLGSTTPDIRVLTKEPREKYHFVSLNFDNIGDGINNMMQQFPVLQDMSQTNQLKPFLAGYFSHLILDETWITKIFRPLFGKDSNFKNNIYGRILDRAIQLKLEEEARLSFSPLLDLIRNSTLIDNIPFIDSIILKQWRSWVVNFLDKPFTWDRLNFMAKRVAANQEINEALSISQKFLNNMPNSIKELELIVPPKEILKFKKDYLKTGSSLIKEFLICES
jgi:hypothetical protein